MVAKSPLLEEEASRIAAQYAEFVAGFDFQNVPGPIVERALLSILDSFGVAFAATRFEFAEKTDQSVRSLAGAGEFAVIGHSDGLPLRDAAVMNGTLIHGLDYDDTHGPSIVHTSASALPTALAMGQLVNATGPQAISAYLIAVEAAARLGQVAKGSFQRLGFHPTGVVAAFGSCLASCYLRGMSRQLIESAQGIALSFASGSLQFLEGGAWTKRIHPGWASSAGITAAALAQGGFVGPAQPYEGRFGLYNAYLGEEEGRDLTLAVAGLSKSWEIERVAIKPYPVCHFNHTCIDAAIELRSRHGIAPNDIVAVTASIHPEQMPVVCEPADNKRRPVSDYDAKFSLPFNVAAALVRGRFTLAELEPDALSDEAILNLVDRVRCTPLEASRYPDYYSGEVRIETQSGEVFSKRNTIHRGSDQRPLVRGDVEQKFFANCEGVIDEAQAHEIAQAVFALPQSESLLPLRELLTA